MGKTEVRSCPFTTLNLRPVTHHRLARDRRKRKDSRRQIGEQKLSESTQEQDGARRAIVSAAFASFLAGTFRTKPSLAAPPIFVIAEELGYFPVTNSKGETVYVSKRVTRESSEQAKELAEYLARKRVVLAGTYWCPHTSRQKELLGRQAFAKISYVECSSRGYGGNPAWCLSKQIDGYPTWIFPDGRRVSGERPLAEIAKEAGFRDFEANLETNLPPPIGSGACSIRNK